MLAAEPRPLPPRAARSKRCACRILFVPEWGKLPYRGVRALSVSFFRPLARVPRQPLVKSKYSQVDGLAERRTQKSNASRDLFIRQAFHLGARATNIERAP